MDPKEAPIYSAAVISAVVLACVFIYFFISIIRQQRRIVKLQKENNTAEITAMEKERTRVASDLHDEIGPYLVSMKVAVYNMKLENEAHGQYIQKAIDTAFQRVREISYDLMPGVLLRKGFSEAVREMVLEINRTHNIGIGISQEGTLKIAGDKAIHLMRIIQEVFQNTLKHSHATEGLIVIEKQNDLFVMKIADNGIGMDYDEKLKESSGFGLRSIQNRVNLLGGNLFVQTGKGKGLSYVFEFPAEGIIIE